MFNLGFAILLEALYGEYVEPWFVPREWFADNYWRAHLMIDGDWVLPDDAAGAILKYHVRNNITSRASLNDC